MTDVMRLFDGLVEPKRLVSVCAKTAKGWTVSNFNWALRATLNHEGGFANHPLDPGGATSFGISLRFLKSIGEDIDGDGDIDIDDILMLTEEDAHDFYYEHFWLEAKCDKVRSDLLSPKIFDMAVNLGSRRAWTIVQLGYNRMTIYKNIGVDGIPGTETLTALNKALEEDWLVIRHIREQQGIYYTNLVNQNPHLKQFLRGWLRRSAF